MLLPSPSLSAAAGGGRHWGACVPVQDCNAVIYDGGYVTSGFSAANAIWDSATYETGTAPCTLVVSSSGGGSLTIVNNAGAVIFRRP